MASCAIWPGAHATSTSDLVVPSGLLDDFSALRTQTHGQVGLALLPVGGNRPVTLGDWSNGVAWSTIKIPLAIAALRHQASGLGDNLTAAITASDNDAAYALWQSLGTPEQAAVAVETVLRESGDAATDVADRHNPANHNWAADSLAFGTTVWSLTNQVHFASRLPCLRDADPVEKLMGQVVPVQSWGLGSFLGARFKGGWGPDDTGGGYSVRQLGLLATHSGTLAVALAAHVDSGGFDDAALIGTRIATIVAQYLGQLNGGSCA
ncbi:hypothetical protein ACFXHA_37860 [Nocardia sp. NPDC059240]|uniref:hypothetical protein n=1 Tax=Nocardia sp. NPDC059240 TaxID=3346786 RepID=UPI003673F2AF